MAERIHALTGAATKVVRRMGENLKMKGRERIRRLLENLPVDRPPVMASFIAWGAQQRGIAQQRIHQEPEINAATLVGLSRELELDGAYISSDNWIMHSALGGQVEFPDDDEPWGHPPVLEEWDRLAELHVPDPMLSGRMPFMLEAARRAVALNRGELFLEANIDSGPFQLCGILRGAQRLMLDVTNEPKKVHRLLEFSLQMAQAYAQAMASTGVDAIQFGDSTASLIGKAMYDEFVRPYQEALIKTIRQAGCYPFLHVCGKTDQLTPSLALSGAACVEIDGPANLKKTIAECNNRLVVRGNVSTPLLHSGSVAQVELSARACLREAGRGRLILSPGCGVPRGTPPENIRSLVRMAQQAAGAP